MPNEEQEFLTSLKTILDDNILKIVVSNQILKAGKTKRVEIKKVRDGFFVSRYSDRQVFNQTLTEGIEAFLFELKKGFRQFNFFSTTKEYELKFSKKNKMLLSSHKIQSPVPLKEEGQNREKNYIFREGEKIAPLVDMGIFTAEGKVVKSMYDKFKQINRFIELIDNSVSQQNLKTVNMIDFGCGKSYLTFLVYYYFKFIKEIDVRIIGLDLKEDVIEKCNQTAQKYGYENMTFQVGDIKDYHPPFEVDMIVTLHACDTATDFALYNAVRWNAKMIFSVPCCQHEVNKQLKSSSLSIVSRYGIAQERLSAIFTDIVRCNLLEYCSYKVDLIEFVDISATPKNLLIRATKTNIPQNVKEKMKKEVDLLKTEFNFTQKLDELLFNNN